MNRGVVVTPRRLRGPHAVTQWPSHVAGRRHQQAQPATGRTVSVTRTAFRFVRPCLPEGNPNATDF